METVKIAQDPWSLSWYYKHQVVIDAHCCSCCMANARFLCVTYHWWGSWQAADVATEFLQVKIWTGILPKVSTNPSVPTKDLQETKVPYDELMNHQVEDMCQAGYMQDFSQAKVGQQVSAIITHNLIWLKVEWSQSSLSLCLEHWPSVAPVL